RSSALGFLADDIGLTGLPLGVEAVEFHVEPFLARLAGILAARRTSGRRLWRIAERSAEPPGPGDRDRPCLREAAHARPASPARHRPGMELAAADGNRRIRHDTGTGRGRRSGRAASQPAVAA